MRALVIPTYSARSNPSGAFVSDLFHSMSQPLTALECGLKCRCVGQDSPTVSRARSNRPWPSAKLLHQRLLEARGYRTPGSPATLPFRWRWPVCCSQLREDFLPVAESAIGQTRCEVRNAIAVLGNEARFRNGFFYLLRLSVRTCRPRQTVAFGTKCTGLASSQWSFSNYRSTGPILWLRLKSFTDPSDLSFQIAQCTFRAAVEIWC